MMTLTLTRRFKAIPLGLAVGFIFLGLISMSAMGEEGWWDEGIRTALEKAGANRGEMEKALRETPMGQRESIVFLIKNMPAKDLQTLKGDFLTHNIALAHTGFAQAPWSSKVSKELFLNDILPYAIINETREDWRESLRGIALPLVTNCVTITKAATRLNQQLFPLVKVRYSTERKKANQAPYESINTGLASCTGLSILLVDACRSVGIPARLAGIPNWIDNRGNHTWVEIWDGEWHFTGAAEPDPNGLDRGWFAHDASLAVKTSPEHAIYATSFKKTDLPFPMVWARNEDFISSENVTDRYTPKAKPVEGSLTRLMVKVLEYPGGKRVAAVVTAREEGGDVKMEGTSKDEKFDTNDLLSFNVGKGRAVVLTAAYGGKTMTIQHTTGTNAQELLALPMQETAPASVSARACTFPRCGVKALPRRNEKSWRVNWTGFSRRPRKRGKAGNSIPSSMNCWGKTKRR